MGRDELRLAKTAGRDAGMMAGEVASLKLSRRTVPIVYFMMRRREQRRAASRGAVSAPPPPIDADHEPTLSAA